MEQISQIAKAAEIPAGMTSLSRPTAKNQIEEVGEVAAAVRLIGIGSLAIAKVSESEISRIKVLTPLEIHIGAKLIVFFTLIGITEDFVGFVNFFEFFLRRGVIRMQIRMIFFRQLAIRFFNLCCGCPFIDAKRLVIVLILQSILLSGQSMDSEENSSLIFFDHL